MLRCPHCGQDETFLVHEWLDHHILIRCTADDYTIEEETQVDEITWDALTCPACQRPTSEHAAREAATPRGLHQGAPATPPSASTLTRADLALPAPAPKEQP